MYKFGLLSILFILLQYGFSNALPKFRPYRMARNAATPNVNELKSPLEIQNLADNADNEVRAILAAVGSSNTQMHPPVATSDPKPAKHHWWHFGCRENTDRDTRSLNNVDSWDDNVELEVRQGGQQQPIPTQQQQQQQPTMPMQGQVPQMQGQVPQMQGQVPQMQGQVPQMQGQMPQMQGQMPQMQGQMPQMQGQVPQMQGQVPQMQGQLPQMQPGNMQPMHPPDGQYHGQYQPQMPMGQPQAGYAMQPPHNGQQMGWPTNMGNVPYPPNSGLPYNGYPANSGLPYSGYPPTGQMQLPVPPSQFGGYGPANALTNPVYNTPLSASQNDLEAQIASAFLSTQLSNMMRDPNTREGLLYFFSELRSFLSNPNAIPMMKAINNRAQEVMNTPSMYNQFVPQNLQHLPQNYPHLPHGTSTIVQVQDTANHMLDKMKAKGGKIMSFVKEMADANSRMLEGTTADIPVVNSVVKIGTGLANAGVGFVDGLLSPWLHPSGHGGTTITTVSTPQTYPNTQYQQPTSITVGK